MVIRGASSATAPATNNLAAFRAITFAMLMLLVRPAIIPAIPILFASSCHNLCDGYSVCAYCNGAMQCLSDLRLTAIIRAIPILTASVAIMAVTFSKLQK